MDSEALFKIVVQDNDTSSQVLWSIAVDLLSEGVTPQAMIVRAKNISVFRY